jgi:hypothetical protein
MEGKVLSTGGRSPLLSVLLISGFVGLCFGLSNATWQVTVETGQVLAGIAKYPADNPFYMYHIKVFTIVNHVSALLLRLLGSERIVSIVFSGLLGMVSFQAISLFIFAISRNIYISVIGVIFIYLTNLVGDGVVYPIWLLGQQHTYGMLGLAFVLLVIALFAAEAYRPALFLLGLAPSVHPSWGTWLLLLVALTSLFHLSLAKKTIKDNYWCFVAGLLISISSLSYQLYLMRGLPALHQTANGECFDAYVKYWDSHRRPFYWDFSVPDGPFKRWGVIFCIYSTILGSLNLKYFRENESLSFLFRLITLSGLLVLLLGFVTQFPPDKIPTSLLILMPGRYANLNNIVLAASILGMLTHVRNKHFVTNYNLFVFFLISSFFSRHSEVQTVAFAIVLFWFAYLIFKSGSFDERSPFLATRKHKVRYETLLLIFMAIFLAINLPREKFVNRYLAHRSDFKDRTNDQFYAQISQRRGILITGHHYPLISLKTRRPILADMASPNFIIYAPEAVEIFNEILNEVYGIDLLTPPPKEYQRREIPPLLYKDIWERRTVEEWQDIGEKFAATDVLAKDDWKLSLPIVARGHESILYEIPAR